MTYYAYKVGKRNKQSSGMKVDFSYFIWEG